MMDPVFDRDFETGEPIGKELSRVFLGDGSIARLYLFPDGLHIMIPTNSKFVHIGLVDESMFSGSSLDRVG